MDMGNPTSTSDAILVRARSPIVAKAPGRDGAPGSSDGARPVDACRNDPSWLEQTEPVVEAVDGLVSVCYLPVGIG